MLALHDFIDDSLLNVSSVTFMNETACMEDLLREAQWFAPHAEAIRQRASSYIEEVRVRSHISPLEAFQREYSLSSHEGMLIMCLAEALLRIPDTPTADALIHDKLSSGDWDWHVGLGRSWLVSMSTLGLGIAGKIADDDALKRTAGGLIGSLIHRLGEPMVRAALKQAMKLMGNVFVLGDTLAQAHTRAMPWRRKGYLFSFDMLGEGARSAEQAQGYCERYLQAIRSLSSQSDADIYRRHGISIKLSALHPRLELRQWEKLKRELYPVLKEILNTAVASGVPVTMDAEESTRLDITLLLFKALFTDPELNGYEGLGMAVQAYQKRAPYTIEYLRALAQQQGKRIPVRLVKGAYWDSEIKHAQAEGLADYPVYMRKHHTDISYLVCAKLLLQEPRCFYPQFATHNARTIASILEMAGQCEYEFQRLHGMGEGLYETVCEDSKRTCRIYAPVGQPKQLLSYLIRRILENGANSSFVRGLYDSPLEDLLVDPLVHSRMGKSNSAPVIPLPEHIYPARINSRGYDIGNAYHLHSLQTAIAAWSAEKLYRPQEAMPSHCQAAFASADEAFVAWSKTSAETRADILERMADLLAGHQDELMALCMYEAGKTLADCVAEVREAIDYCRYYAQEARRIFIPQRLQGISGEHNMLCLHPRGIIVAISPWNFPLAIFIGQVAAALAAGNCVIAKPSEETPCVAARAVALMHEAGIPRDVLHLLCGGGETIGKALVSDIQADGVVFTGSTQAARAINRALAARNAPIVPLIAETGGQNCMVIDSSALIEQAVDDIIVSAFSSAGQRCSCLRVAFVQDDIADELLPVLAGAMQELRLGLPADFSVDVGPVISRQAYEMLRQHIATMQENATLIAATPLPKDAGKHLIIAPHAFEIRSIQVLKEEVFGPILHIIRYSADQLDNVIAQINSTGYGLTFGIQSRIDGRIRELTERVRAGNVYVNRSMIGATVGSQPFGGSSLSGTGPKAGGPNYLLRFCQEQTVSINTAAIGGNIELLTG
jgi:RHH-type transcriptional regulator, proline utilization regulon repressor / proline dehydrogenase / delta 1-pyrroline-5-carboxylate dehydrogenase